MAEYIASLAVPVIVCIVGLLMLFGKYPYFDSFVEGAKDGLSTAVRLLPTLVALMVGVNMLKASGALDTLSGLLAPAASFLGIPSELLPLLMTRPFSGSASTAAYSSLLENYGADSYVALCASVIMGSSDTMLYVITVYFSSVGVKKSRYAIPCATLVMLFCIFFSCLICRIWFKTA
ncbi:MAG: spore maturation protein [Eubacteriales bacterium]